LTNPSGWAIIRSPFWGVVVHAVGKQYAWSLSEGEGPTLATWDQTYSPAVTVPAGTQVEFRVTTLDVNHGFSLYGPDGRLVAQTQAMPGYLNRLRITLDQPGTYTVLCLKFCGMGHHRLAAARRGGGPRHRSSPLHGNWNAPPPPERPPGHRATSRSFVPRQMS
jgi:plastocyanin